MTTPAAPGMSVEEAVARELATHLVTGGPWVFGRNIKTGPVRKATDNTTAKGAVPERCIFVIGSGGVDDIPFHDGGLRHGIRRPTVQIRFRGGRNEYTEDKGIADAVWEAADKHPPAGFQEARALASQPIFLGLDAEQHPEWTVNLLLMQQV